MNGFRLVRVDDRLLHGQVALGWRHALDPRAIWIVDDATAADPFAVALFEAALPDGLSLRVLEVDGFAREAAAADPGPAAGAGAARTILLVRGVDVLRALIERGFRPAEVNLGGLHDRPGARRILDYIYLTAADREHLLWILDRGIDVTAQDLPGAPRRSLRDLLLESEDGGGA